MVCSYGGRGGRGGPCSGARNIPQFIALVSCLLRFRDFSSWTVRGATLSVVLVRSHGHKVRTCTLGCYESRSYDYRHGLLACVVGEDGTGNLWTELEVELVTKLAPINLQIRSTAERLLQVERDGRKSIGWTPKTSYRMPRRFGKEKCYTSLIMVTALEALEHIVPIGYTKPIGAGSNLESGICLLGYDNQTSFSSAYQ